MQWLDFFALFWFTRSNVFVMFLASLVTTEITITEVNESLYRPAVSPQF